MGTLNAKARTRASVHRLGASGGPGGVAAPMPRCVRGERGKTLGSEVRRRVATERQGSKPTAGASPHKQSPLPWLVSGVLCQPL